MDQLIYEVGKAVTSVTSLNINGLNGNISGNGVATIGNMLAT
jgi:hypothetical protein